MDLDSNGWIVSKVMINDKNEMLVKAYMDHDTSILLGLQKPKYNFESVTFDVV